MKMMVLTLVGSWLVLCAQAQAPQNGDGWLKGDTSRLKSLTRARTAAQPKQPALERFAPDTTQAKKQDEFPGQFSHDTPAGKVYLLPEDRMPALVPPDAGAGRMPGARRLARLTEPAAPIPNPLDKKKRD